MKNVSSTSNKKLVIHQPRKAALRLIDTKSLSRTEWLKARKQGIGGSDAAAAIGISPYQSSLELWMNKTGRIADYGNEKVLGHRAPMYWGNVLEPIIAQQYSLITGRKVRKVNSILQNPDEDKHWMLANLDYSIVGSEDTHILECKTAGEFGAKHWRDGVPDYVVCQVQHQLAVTGKEAADVCVLICGQELQIYRVERDESLINSIIKLERYFWQHVLDDTPPDPDGSDSAGDALQKLYPSDNGKTMDWRDNVLMNNRFNNLLNVRDDLTKLSLRESELKQLLQKEMGEATKAELQAGRIVWKRSKDSLTLDSAKLLSDKPELMVEYSKLREGSRRFNLIEKKTLH